MKKKYYFLALFLVTPMFFLTFVNVAGATDYHTPEAKVFDIKTANQTASFMAYDEGFKGGGNIAVCDVNGKGATEIFVGAGPGGGPHVRAFNSSGEPTGTSFFPFHPDFRGGIDVACGDVNGDKKDELVVSQFSEGQAWVKVYKIDKEKTILAEFKAYADNYLNGAHVAACDIDGNGKAEVITGTGMNSTSHVRGFTGVGGEYMGLSLFPFEQSYRGGVDVACGNVDGGKESEVVVAKNTFGNAEVKVYKADKSKTILGDFIVFGEGYKDGANVATGDLDGDGEDEIAVGSNGQATHIKTFEAYGKEFKLQIRPYEEEFRGGVKVAIGNVNRKGLDEIVTFPGRRVWEGRRDSYKYVEVDLSDQTLKAYQGGMKVNEFLVSTGVAKYPTPVGDFNVWIKFKEDGMVGYYGDGNPDNYDIPDVPFVQYFNGPYALHGAYWHNNFGHPMSHGCVNISVSNAAWLDQWINVGDRVIVQN